METHINKNIFEVPFLIVDFETVLLKGRPPEPIELAALRVKKDVDVDVDIDECFSVEWLIQPPLGVSLTAFNIALSGITWNQVKDKPFVNKILCEFEKIFLVDDYILVAHNARYEAAIFKRFESICPSFSRMKFIDTIPLAKKLLPKLPNYKLNTLAHYFSIPLPLNRHRALPDVKVTVQILLKLLEIGQNKCKINNLMELQLIAGLENKLLLPTQQSLFD
jgi:DNA polymerase-3 subunit epsilon